MSNFKTIIPLSLIKGKDPQGNQIMKMRGVASTPSLDSDGENLDPKGFDTSYFLKYGFMNWNHQTNTDPLSIVGRPYSATVNPLNELIIDFSLFSKSQKAKEVFELQQILEEQGMALGLSIEGKVLERKSKDKTHPDYKKVTKALITGCAITPNPKNKDTVAEIIKGENFKEISAYEDDEEGAEKALSASSASGQAIAKESLAKKLTNLEGPNEDKKLTKSQAVNKILGDLPDLSIESAGSIFDLASKIEKSIIMAKETETTVEEKVSPEAISKALETLGLQDEAQQEEISKGEDAQSVEGESQDQIEKGEQQQEEGEQASTSDDSQEEVSGVEDIVAKGEEMIAQMQQMIDLVKGSTKKDSQQEQQQEEQIEKGEQTTEDAQQEQEQEISKGEQEDVQGTQVNDELIKAITASVGTKISEVKSASDWKFEAVGTLYKGLMGQVEDLKKGFDDIKNLNFGSKSVTTHSYKEKNFNQDEQIQKGESDGKQVLSISNKQHKRFLLDQITKAITADGQITDQVLAGQVIAFEQAGNLSKGIIGKAKELGYTLVQ